MVARGGRVTIVTEPGHAWETRSRGVESIVAPFGDGSGWLAALRSAAAGGGETVVLPATDRGSELLVRAREELPDNLIAFERAEDSSHLALMDKHTADAIARRAGVNVPWTACIQNAGELEQALASATWPCVVKPILSHAWRMRYGEERTFLAANAEEARRLLARPLADGLGMLLSQYIPGGDDDVEEAIVVRLADGSYPVAFGCRKLRQYPRGFGATALGVSSALTETTALARAVLDEAGFVGVAGVEAKRHAVTGERWFLEVNVRMPAQWGLGDACGAEATPRLVAALAGRPLGPAPAPREGVRIVVPDIDVLVCRGLLREVPAWRRPALAARLLRPWFGAGEKGVLDLRDPGPGAAWLRTLAGRRVPARLRKSH
jgi:predicted ATP-grasp superfamily ATP-dependent carboligase